MDTVVAALRHAPELTAKLIERFCALHDPETRDAKRAEALADEIQAAFAGIKSIDEDRILRLFNAVIGATLRTNAFAPAAAEDRKSVVAGKRGSWRVDLGGVCTLKQTKKKKH